MKIEIWSDFVCPFCYIGKRRLEQALQSFPHRDAVTLEFKSYQLHPEAKHMPEMDFCETLSNLKGISLEEAKTMNEQVASEAKSEGLTYRFDTMRYTNTFDAHRLLQYAERKGKGVAITEGLLHAYFTKSALLSDLETLVHIANEVGLDEEETRAILQSQKFSLKVKDDIAVATQIGVKGVPFFVFNEEYAVSGVQSSKVFSQILEKLWEEEERNPTTKRTKAKTLYCTDDGCYEQ